MTDPKDKEEEAYPNSSKISIDKARELIQKAMDLRILEQKEYDPEMKRYLGGFTPRFLEACNRYLDKIKAEGVDDKKYVFDWYEVVSVILDYWMDIGGVDAVRSLSDSMDKDVSDYRLMCDMLVRIMDKTRDSKKCRV